MPIHAPSYSLIIFNSISLLLIIKKLEFQSLDWSWMTTLSPTFFYFFYNIIKCLLQLLTIEIPNDSNAPFKEKNPKLVIFTTLYHLLQNIIFIAMLIIIIEIIETTPYEQRTYLPLYIICSIYMLFHSLYTFCYKNIQPKTAILPISTLNETNKTQDISFFASLMTPLFNFLGSSVAICAGGSCTAIYGSTLSAIFGAFGITITEWLPYLDGLTALLIFISVYMLYTAKRDWTYKPFLISILAAIMIFIHMITHEYKVFLYLGNVLMIAGAIWNIKLNKVKFGRSKKNLA